MDICINYEKYNLQLEAIYLAHLANARTFLVAAAFMIGFAYLLCLPVG